MLNDIVLIPGTSLSSRACTTSLRNTRSPRHGPPRATSFQLLSFNFRRLCGVGARKLLTMANVNVSGSRLGPRSPYGLTVGGHDHYHGAQSETPLELSFGIAGTYRIVGRSHFSVKLVRRGHGLGRSALNGRRYYQVCRFPAMTFRSRYFSMDEHREHSTIGSSREGSMASRGAH